MNCLTDTTSKLRLELRKRSLNTENTDIVISQLPELKKYVDAS